MSIPKYAAHRDLYEPEIIKAFREGGATVQPLSIRNAPDLAVGYLGVTHLVEAKTGDRMPTEDQQRWHDAWRGERVVIVRNAAQAKKYLRIWTMQFAEAQSHGPSLEDDLGKEPEHGE